MKFTDKEIEERLKYINDLVAFNGDIPSPEVVADLERVARGEMMIEDVIKNISDRIKQNDSK